ncbi:MAG: hypothetical protein ACRC0X_06285 [Brevinema sp.]
MNKINKFLTVILCVGIIFQWVNRSYAQELSQAKLAIQSYIDSWFVNNNSENWLIETQGIKFPSDGLEIGLNTLNENLKNADISKVEKEQIKNRFIQTYIDQSVILALSYQDIISNPDLDILLQEFLRQAATQLWLENQMAQEPSSILPSEEEINQYYQANSDRLLRLGLSASQIKSFTEQELKQAKLQEWTYRKLAEVKEQHPAKINPKLKKKYNLK